MRRFFALALVAVALFGLVAGGVGTIAAQDQADVENATGADRDDAQDGDQNDSSVMFDLDDEVRVLDVDYDSESGLLEVEVENTGDTSEVVHLIEVVETGSESWGWESPRIRAGETTTIRLEDVDDQNGEEAVMIATESGLEERRVEWITTGESLQWFDGPATWGLAGLAALATGGGTFWGVRRFLAKRRAKGETRRVEVVR